MIYLVILPAAVFALAFCLFVGGIVSAWREGRQEKRAGLPVSRPGWRNVFVPDPVAGQKPITIKEQILIAFSLYSAAYWLQDRRFAKARRRVSA